MTIEHQRRVAAEDHILIRYRISCAGVDLEASEPGQATSYQMGQGMWPIQLELEMINEVEGAELVIKISAGSNVFGVPDPERIVHLQLADFSIPPELEALIEFELPDGESVEGQVLDIRDDQVEVDFNHPYAGRELDIWINIEKIIPVTGE